MQLNTASVTGRRRRAVRPAGNGGPRVAEGACGRSTDDASADRDELLLPVVIDDEFADRSGRPVNTRGVSNAINTPCYGLLRWVAASSSTMQVEVRGRQRQQHLARQTDTHAARSSVVSRVDARDEFRSLPCSY